MTNGDPKKKYNEALQMLKQDQDFIEADSTEKTEMLNWFFDTFGTPYLKTQGVVETNDVEAYKTFFIDKMMSPEEGSKKKLQFRLKKDRQNQKKIQKKTNSFSIGRMLKRLVGFGKQA